jgi:hypothetical protein
VSCERKERKGWERGEKRRETAGMGKEDSSLHLGLENEPGKRFCCFSGYDSEELESNLQAPAV